MRRDPVGLDAFLADTVDYTNGCLKGLRILRMIEAPLKESPASLTSGAKSARRAPARPHPGWVVVGRVDPGRGGLRPRTVGALPPGSETENVRLAPWCTGGRRVLRRSGVARRSIWAARVGSPNNVGQVVRAVLAAGTERLDSGDVRHAAGGFKA